MVVGYFSLPIGGVLLLTGIVIIGSRAAQGGSKYRACVKCGAKVDVA